ncbi:MAG: TetR family transcriptional regulator C-terminal domain-containing protein [Gammaproteobacteria bacterium]|uniref:HTH-type transcriptional regulator BetI n=1 Tax=Pseudomonas fluorescens TaxID=294 RepID=A0A5E7GMJ2_PSEFL|nr:TetR family transcriptional regulator C-terminal domain-containing protein [Gammaproteobacteria bacterium]MBU0822429.1 TetR family transcriptional regulator C-terminal domain-containing protein [Gammaproteobacteria bacterium]MBU0841056.1 TetR family transcriptional regulator C-terminal domain-containing protein [Gammaproteobacteria bacterium]MBU1841925.1 TetR family transcriptional regulator C-terminal domain-containing protein [Gammaproteobacteria bacterium]VVO52112.1 HTH-type transcription
MTTPSPKNRRAEPDERREMLVAATLRCLVRDGHAGISVRRIATEAGVSVGLLNHHFGSIDALIADTYQKIASELTTALRLEIQQAATPAQKMDAFLVGSFSPRVMDPQLLGVWVVFWSLIRHSEHVSQSHEKSYRAYLDLLRQLLDDMAASEGFVIHDTRLAAIGLSAMLDGLWIEWCLNPETFSPANGLHICRCWIKGLRHGAFSTDDIL